MADPKKIIGGLGRAAKRFLSSDEQLTAAQRAEAGRRGAELIKSQQQVNPSEALGQLMEKGYAKTATTQADRTRVGGGNIGGAPFSAISEADPAYAGKVWGVMDEGTAKRLTNLTTPETAWTTMLGSANQLKTNPVVFDKLKRGFQASMKEGNLSPELEAKINHNLALTFGEGASIRDPSIWKQADTFEKRAALADLMMGQGIAPKKGGVSLGGEKSGKGVIFKPTDILKRETEPSLMHTEHEGDVPTFAAGPRLFKLEKETEYRPDLHPGFPTLIGGKDLGYNVKPAPTEVYLPDWHAKFKKDNPERYPPFKTDKQGGPGYYDLALGVKGEGLPSQQLNDEYIRHLLREGFKDGGEVDASPEDQELKDMIADHMEGQRDDPELRAMIEGHMASGGGVFKRLQFTEEGSPLQTGVHASKMDKDESLGVSANLDMKGAGRLGIGSSLGGRDGESRPSAMVNYSNNVGDLGINANVMKPMDTKEDMLMTNVMASYPVGQGRISAGMHGNRMDGAHRVNAHSLGYNAPLGGGNLNLNVTKPREGKPMFGAQYNKSFADGGKLVKGIAKAGKRLMGDDVLPAAEREANLTKFLEGNKAPPTVYHSTSKDFNQFSPQKLGQNTKHPTTKLGFFTAADPASTEDFISSTSGVSKGLYESGANIMPLHVSIKNPYEIPSTKYLLQSMALQNMKKKDADKYVQDFVDSLKAEGHDGLLIKANPKGLAGGNEFTSDNWVAFEPTQIKSATGNRGTYDINDPDLSKADGGLAMANGGIPHMAGAGRVVKGLGKMGKRLMSDPTESAMASTRRGADQMGGLSIIKEPGGNWLTGGTGSVENALQPLKRKTQGGMTPEDALAQMQERFATVPNQQNNIRNLQGDVALNNWVDRNLTNYVKKQMGTADDPVRKLAEEGVIHAPTNEVGVNRYNAGRVRAAKGQPQLGKSDAAKAWEDATDTLIFPAPADEYLMSKAVAGANPWLAKVAPKTSINQAGYGIGKDLGFDHIMDVLKIDIAAGRIRPEQLNKVSMEQAVRRTAEYDQEMAKKMREAQIKATEGMPTHKEYPEGYKWLELTQPKELPKGWTQEASGAYISPTGDRTIVNPSRQSLEDALKYEGETMGHCVGSYCDDVAGGKSRIYSLRDAKGEPHVTIETTNRSQPTVYTIGSDNYVRLSSDIKKANPNLSVKDHDALVLEAYNKEAASNPPSIKQIKGKQNRAPNEEYLPFVQDFVRSGKWSDVGDIENTGMRATKSVFNEAELQKLREAGEIDIPHVLSGEDAQRLHNLIVPEGKRLKYDVRGNVTGSDEGFADGGGAFKTLQWRDAQHFDGGGLASPEDNNTYESKPSRFSKVASEMYGEAKQSLADDYDRLKNSARARAQLAKIAALQMAGGANDFAGMVTPLINSDALLSAFPAARMAVTGMTGSPSTGRRESVLSNERIPYSLADLTSDKEGLPYGGSEHLIKRAQDAGLMYGKTRKTFDEEGEPTEVRSGRFGMPTEIGGAILGGMGLSKINKLAGKGYQKFAEPHPKSARAEDNKRFPKTLSVQSQKRGGLTQLRAR